MAHKLAIPPDKVGYSPVQGAEGLYVQLDGGKGRYRRDQLGAAVRVVATWTVGPTDYRYLRAFYHVHYGGSVEFDIDLVLDTESLATYSAHMIPSSWKLSAISGLTYVVEMELEITRKTPINYGVEEAIVATRIPFAWETFPIGDSLYQDVKSNGFVWIAAGNDGIYRSNDDGRSWSRVHVASFVYAIGYRSGGIWVAVGEDVTFYSTDNGLTWTPGGALPASSALYAVTYGDLGWVAVGDGVGGATRAVVSTNNGATWTDIPGMASGGGAGVVFWQGQYYVAGIGFITRSANLSSWVTSTLPDGGYNDIAIAPGIGLVATGGAMLGGDSICSISSDGQSWSDEFVDGLYAQNVTIVNDTILLIGMSPSGTTGVVSSKAGQTWVNQTIAQESLWCAQANETALLAIGTVVYRSAL